MKTKISTLFLIFIAYSQYTLAFVMDPLSINAGNDTIICASNYTDTLVIGGTPTAAGGIPPYTYEWSTSYSVGSSVFGAKYFLNDSSIANPKLTDFTLDGEPLTIKLKVTDSYGNVTEDSVTIRFSLFMFLTMECRYDINKGDTVSLLSTAGGGIEPLKYEWSPAYNITNSQIMNSKVWPETDTTYHLKITDSIGCIANTECSIYLKTTEVKTATTTQISISPNPVEDYFQIDGINEKADITIYGYDGKIILNKEIENKEIIPTNNFESGIYIINIKTSGSSFDKKFIKK